MRSTSTTRRTGTTGGSAISEVVISSDTLSLSSTICSRSVVWGGGEQGW